MSDRPQQLAAWRQRLWVIIFESDTPAGKAFDVALIWLILASVGVVMLESVEDYHDRFGPLLRNTEWVFTTLFAAEYLLRLLCVRRPTRYALSFFGLIDLLAILPTLISAVVPGAQYLLVIRVLRILRVFRVLKLAHHVKEAQVLTRALYMSRRKITVFLFAVFTLVVILGSLMHLIEGKDNGFTSIPRGVYWAVVTLTTVGYGDISPQTPGGQALAAIVMVLGYGIIAVPTGIVTAELTAAARSDTRICASCETVGHAPDSHYCRICGAALVPATPPPRRPDTTPAASADGDTQSSASR